MIVGPPMGWLAGWQFTKRDSISRGSTTILAETWTTPVNIVPETA